MTTRIWVSRYFEPVPHMRVEARYEFVWTNGELDAASLSQRKDRKDGFNSQFEKVEDVPLDDIPDDVIQEARRELEEYADQLTESADGGREEVA